MQTKKPHHPPAGKDASSPLEQFLAERDLRAFCLQAGEDLSGLMGTILGELTYGLSTGNPTVQGRSMAVALTAAEKALHLSASLRFLGGVAPPATRQADISQLLLETVETVEAEFGVRGIRMRVLAESPTGANTDPVVLKHLLTNLMLSLADGMPGGGELHAALKQEEKSLLIQLIAQPVMPEARARFPDLPKTTPFRLAKELLLAQGGELHFGPVEGKPAVTVRLTRDPSAPPPPTFETRRRSQRVRVSLTGELVLPNQGPVPLQIPILSEKGCYLLFGETVPRGLRVNMQGSLKIFYFEGQSVDVECIRIASLDPKGHHQGVGVEFLKLDARAKNLIAALIRSHSG